jgi:hypothetical protein
MARVDGAMLRVLRRSRDWDVPQTARELRRAAREAGVPVATLSGLVRMIYAWERGDHKLSERYELLLSKAFEISPLQSRDHTPGQPNTAAASYLAARNLMPRFGLDEIKHVAAALDDARRYMDGDVVGYFSQRIAELAADDGERGPRRTLPPVIGIIAAIEHGARQVKPAIRRQLLAVGARAAEFAGFLYRDIASPETAAYWRDRATEWAQEGGHAAMQGYVVLRKSQAAWDERDALRMLTLAQAAQDSIWRLPARVRAEAAQQEARGYAMLGSSPGEMERKLDEARQLMETGPDSDGETLGSGYTTSLLAMQTAMCHSEAGQPGVAVDIYARQLTESAFSYRDFGYFRALMAGALAGAGEPGAACEAGMQAIAIAQETSSVRTGGELVRVAGQLRLWQHRSDVRELQALVLAI